MNAGHSAADRPAEPPRPFLHAPLLLPAMAFLLGVGAADSQRPSSDSWAVWGYFIAIAAAIGHFVSHRRPACDAARWPTLALCFAALGFARSASIRSASGFAWADAIPNEGMLVRLHAEVLTPIESRAGQRRNAFFPQPIHNHVSFLASCRPWDDTTGARAADRVLQISVVADALPYGVRDQLEIRGRIYRNGPPRNPNQTDWRRVTELNGVVASVGVDDASLIRPVASSTSWWQSLRRAAARLAAAALHGDALHPEPDAGDQLLDALILGQRSALDRTWNEAFSRAGAAHFLSVSGFHLAILAASAGWLASALFRASHRTAATVGVGVLGLYMLITEWNAPVLRAALLALCFAAAIWAARPPTPLNWLAAAALLLAFIQPREVLRPGYQLCFSQVAALMLFIPSLIRCLHGAPPDSASLLSLAWRRGWRILVDAVVIAGALWAFATPVVWFHFGQIQPWGALGSLLLAIPMTLLLWLGFGSLLLGLAPAVSDLMQAPLAGLAAANLDIVRMVADLPSSAIRIAPPNGWWLVALYALFAVAWFRDQLALRALQTRAAVVVLTLVVVWPILAYIPSAAQRNETLTAWILDVGNGSCAVVQTRRAAPLIVDAGTLRNQDVAELVGGVVTPTRATIVLSHADLDHYSGIPRLLRENPAARLCSGEFLGRESAPDRQLAAFAAELPPTLQPVTLSATHHWALGDAAIEVLWPVAGATELTDNDQSLVLRVTQHGRSILFPADIEEFALRALTVQHQQGTVDLQSDVLIAPHHGAFVPGATETFLAAVAPEWIIASTARPTDKLAESVAALFGERCRLLTTRDVGAVRIRIDPSGRISVDAPYASHKSQ